MKTASRWYSERVEQEITLVRWGHWGQPVLVFPTAGGDAEEVERMQLVAALYGMIEAGRIKIYSCDSLAGRALAAGWGSVEYRCALLVARYSAPQNSQMRSSPPNFPDLAFSVHAGEQKRVGWVELLEYRPPQTMQTSARWLRVRRFLSRASREAAWAFGRWGRRC